MALQIPYPVTPLKSTSTQDLSIRLNDRVNAQVLSVTGTQAILEINGYPIVARLTSNEQAAELSSRKAAEFIITRLSRDEITLKLAGKADAIEPGAVQVPVRDPAPDISDWLGLKGTRDELYLIKSALRENLPLTKELVNQLLGAVNAADLRMPEGIDLAVRLKTAGLPVTEESLKIAGQFTHFELARVLDRLVMNLREISSQIPDSNPLSGEIKKMMAQLGKMIPDLSESEDHLNTALRELFRFLGKPYESLIREELAGEKLENDAPNLLDLLQLGKSLKESGQTRVSQEIDRFLDQVRQNQFMNIKPDTAPGKGTWGEVNFIVQWQNAKNYQTADAKIKISYRQDKHPKVIDPQFTNIILQVDLEPTKEVIVNLSLCQKKVMAEIMSSRYEVMQMFKESLPEFEELMTDMGYNVIHSSVRLCAAPQTGEGETATWLDLQRAAVNIVV